MAPVSLSINIPKPERLGEGPNASSMPASHPERLGEPSGLCFLLNDGVTETVEKPLNFEFENCTIEAVGVKPAKTVI